MSDLPPAAEPCTDFFGVPPGDACCTVTSFSPASITIPEKMIVDPVGKESNKHPIIISLIQHLPSKQYILFDLGISQNWREYVPEDKLDWVEETFEPEVEEEVEDVLERLGVAKEKVKFIVISHHHWDHCGSSSFSSFPLAQVIVGPSTLSQIVALSPPHYSRPSTSPKPLELSWSNSHEILTFKDSFDLFEDGSFLIVPTPGHTPGHVAAVIRTFFEEGEEEYVVLAGDCAHHPSCLSPPPRRDSSSTKTTRYRFSAWREEGEEQEEGPPKHSMHEDYGEAEESLERLKALEGRREFMVLLAHDFRRWEGFEKDERGTVEISGWRKKGLKE